MKNKWITLFTIVLGSLLFACSSPNDDRTDDHENKATSIEPIGEIDGNQNEATFIGTIEEINGDTALVSIEEGDILSSGSKVDVNLSVASDIPFEIGDKVRVEFDGSVREIFPLGINTTFVELVK